MIYKFLCTEDLRAVIKSEFLNIISENDTAFIVNAETFAVDYMKSFMNQRYVMEDTFPIINDWSNTRNYKKAVEQTIKSQNELNQEVTTVYTPLFMRDDRGIIVNYAYYQGKFYQAISDNNNVTPGTSEDDWIEKDPRNPVVVGFCRDITLYKLHSKIPNHKVPQHRIDDYNQAKEWITLIKDNEISPDLPRPIEVQKNIDTILWGSNKQIRHYY